MPQPVSEAAPSARPGAFRRPISPTEWWFLAHPDELSPTLSVVVEGDGPIDRARLAEAVAVASDVCPGSRLVHEEQSWVDGGTPPPVLVVEAEGPGVTDLANLPELQALLSGPDVPFCRVMLVHGERTAVAFRAHHAVMDARGLLAWAEDVFRVLRGEQPLGAPDPVSDRDVFEATPDADKLALPPHDKPPIMGPCEPTDRSRSVCARRTLQGTHPGVVARLAAVLAELIQEDRPAAFYIPVDLRHSVPDVRSTASLALGLTLEVASAEGWEAVHERLLRGIKDREHLRNVPPPEVLDTPLPTLGTYITTVDETARGKESFPTDAGLSHAGRVEPELLSAPGFTARTAFMLSRPVPTSAPELNLLEVGLHTEITLSWWDGAVTAERIEALLDRVEEELSPAAHRRWAGNDTAVVHPDRTDVVRRFLRRANAQPDALALDGPDEQLTYRQLERRTAVLAAVLRKHGVGPETVVGVLGDRSVASMVAVWGVLRAGGAYLPIDPRNPDARIADLLADAGAPVCLAQRPYDRRDCFPSGCAPLAIEGVDYSADPDLPEAEIREDQLAYVIYTSGSTGRPKGVEVEHGSVRNFTDWAIRDFGIDADTRMPLLASLGFDLAGNSIFLPLLAGGTVVLRPAAIDLAMLGELLTTSGANALTLTPSHLVLINRLGLRPRGFRSVVVIGEQLQTSTAHEAREVFGPDCEIINAYGPTEATIMMTRHRFDPEADTGPVVPIGVPTDNCTVHLLDANGRFVGAGDSGELCIGGGQLARGYRGRPDLTAERFVQLANGTRVYRTGDIARLLPGGELVFEDRVDDQAKILGHRVEPAEIARVLRAHPAVADAVVAARPSGEHKSLAAYVVRAAEVTADALTAHLAATLPPYMLPAATVFVDEIPHTLNGKVNLRSLPDPFRRRPRQGDTIDTATDGHAPLTAAVAAVWAEILGRSPEQISDDADFHGLGGNSLEFLTMLASVADRFVGEDGRDRFNAMFGRLVRRPTLSHLVACTRYALDPSSEPPS
ncbi:non-ribosomal peptide synthetase [Streptomyces sp. NPDC048637]|uniref:non-ribosomal peptide synthetase n=1 Tax=Streptomyces sp. NPDC048637 TaxID=3155636 RepID=UPI003428A778